MEIITQRIQSQKNSFFQLILCDSKMYLWQQKKVRHYVLKKCKYIQKMIEIIFSVYEFCIYSTLWFYMIGISLWTMWKVW